MRINPDSARRFWQSAVPLPGFSKIVRSKQRGVILLASRRVEHLRVRRIDSECRNCPQRVGISDQILVRVIRSHDNGLDIGGLRIYQFPGFAGISTSPQPGGLRVHDFCIEGVKNKKSNHAAQVEHPPRLASIVRNIGSGHVTGDENGIRINRADGGIEHRSPTSRTQNFEIPRANRERGRDKKQGENHLTPDVCHLMLSFTFDIFASPLSGKVPKMSTAKWKLRLRHAEKKRAEGCCATWRRSDRYRICSGIRKSRIQPAHLPARSPGARFFLSRSYPHDGALPRVDG